MQWIFDLFSDYPILFLIALGVIGQMLSPNPRKAREKAKRKRAEELRSEEGGSEFFPLETEQPRETRDEREDEVARQIRDMLSGGAVLAGQSSTSSESLAELSLQPQTEATMKPAGRQRPEREAQTHVAGEAAWEPVGKDFAQWDTIGRAKDGKGLSSLAYSEQGALDTSFEAATQMHSAFESGDLSAGSMPPPSVKKRGVHPGLGILRGADAKQAVRAMLILGPPRSMASLERDSLSPWVLRETPDLREILRAD